MEERVPAEGTASTEALERNLAYDSQEQKTRNQERKKENQHARSKLNCEIRSLVVPHEVEEKIMSLWVG